MDKIAINIKRLRKSKGWTQKELAEILKASQKTITAYETSNKKPSVKRLIELAKLFNVKIEEIVGIEKLNIEKEIPMIHKNSRTYQMQKLYPLLSPEDQRTILKQVKALV